MRLPANMIQQLGHLRYGVGSVHTVLRRGDKAEARRADLQAAHDALADLFPNCPRDFIEDDVLVRRNPLGKPFIEWHRAMEEWADGREIPVEHCHISNTSDGDLHLVFAAYNENLIGVGIDAVWLPRLQRKGKDGEYLLRLARQFMSPAEWFGFEPYTFGASDDVLLIGVAAHFALMEALSKACGTGLKIGLGMGRSASLPMHTLGAAQIYPDVQLLIEGVAIDRFQELGVANAEAYWGIEDEFLLAVVLLYKAGH
jgi:phosphopantetheinyl transferase (holo-ACP synthase)